MKKQHFLFFLVIFLSATCFNCKKPTDSPEENLQEEESQQDSETQDTDENEETITEEAATENESPEDTNENSSDEETSSEADESETSDESGESSESEETSETEETEETVETEESEEPAEETPQLINCSIPIAMTLSPNGSWLDIEFSHESYAANGKALSLSAFSLSYNRNEDKTENVSLAGIAKPDSQYFDSASALEGGEKTVRLFFTFAGNASDGKGSVSITPDKNSIFAYPDETTPTEASLQFTLVNFDNALIISEIMPNPAAVNDSEGEWLEIHNRRDQDINIRGWQLKDGTSYREISPDEDQIIPAGGWLVIAKNSNNTENGGISGAVELESISLKNTEDDLGLLAPGGSIADLVSYRTNWPLSAGKSLSLLPDKLDSSLNDNKENWQEAPEGNLYGAGDAGTPGTTNPASPAASSEE